MPTKLMETVALGKRFNDYYFASGIMDSVVHLNGETLGTGGSPIVHSGNIRIGSCEFRDDGLESQQFIVDDQGYGDIGCFGAIRCFRKL